MNLSKHLQIRIELWVGKLLENDDNVTWKKSRNNYIRLMEEMVLSGDVGDPFNKIPPKGGLAMFHDYGGRSIRKVKTVKDESVHPMFHRV